MIVFFCVLRDMFRNRLMRKVATILLLLFVTNNGWTDIAPNPIILKSIMTNTDCDIRMDTEIVDIDLYADSSFVSCTFNMINQGDSLTLPIGFPVMNFFHWSMGLYGKNDKDKFEIYVDGLKLDENDIEVPDRMKSTYNKYLRVMQVEEEYSKKTDSLKTKFGVIERRNKTIYPMGNYSAYDKAYSKIFQWRQTQPYLDSELFNEFDSLMNNENYAWYIWKVRFQKGESKTIKVNYMVPSGIGYGGEYRFTKYLLSTGSGWKGKIRRAEINVKLQNVKSKTLETISPLSYKFDKKAKTISWTFSDIEPTTDDDICVKYFNRRERKRWENFTRKRTKQLNK
jgi:hypothetical protein